MFLITQHITEAIDESTQEIHDINEILKATDNLKDIQQEMKTEQKVTSDILDHMQWQLDDSEFDEKELEEELKNLEAAEM